MMSKQFFLLVGILAIFFPASLLAEESAVSMATSTVSVALDTRREKIQNEWKDGHDKEAQRLLKQWMKEGATAQPWTLAAEHAYRDRQYKKALKWATKAIDKFPKDADGYYWRGMAYEALRNPLDAGNEFRAALMANPQLASAQAGLNRVLIQLGNEK